MIQELRAQLQTVQDHIDQIRIQQPNQVASSLRPSLFRKKLRLERAIRALAPADTESKRAQDGEGFGITSGSIVDLSGLLAVVRSTEAHPKHGHVCHVITQDGVRRSVRASACAVVPASGKRARNCIGLRAIIKMIQDNADTESKG